MKDLFYRLIHTALVTRGITQTKQVFLVHSDITIIIAVTLKIRMVL